MTNLNKVLGEWLLRDVMDLEENETLRYEMLEGLDIESVKVTKKSNDTLALSFVRLEHTITSN